MYKEELALNNLQWLICHKTKSSQFYIVLVYIPVLSIWLRTRWLYSLQRGKISTQTSKKEFLWHNIEWNEKVLEIWGSAEYLCIAIFPKCTLTLVFVSVKVQSMACYCFVWVLWHIHHCWFFDHKICFYIHIEYICKHFVDTHYLMVKHFYFWQFNLA